MPGTTYHVKVTWTDGTSEELTSSSTWTETTTELSITTSDGHVHTITKANTRKTEKWTTTP